MPDAPPRPAALIKTGLVGLLGWPLYLVGSLALAFVGVLILIVTELGEM